MIQEFGKRRSGVLLFAVAAAVGLSAASVLGDHCHTTKGSQAKGDCSTCSHSKDGKACGEVCKIAKKVESVGATFLTAAGLNEKIKSGQPPVIINVLPVASYTSSRIKGSINIPYKEVGALAPKVLPDKNAEVVVYCGSYQCGASIQAAKTLKELGYTNVYDYKGGLKEWTERGLPLEGDKVKTATKSG